MTIQEWKNNELNKLLLEKWGYRKEDDKDEEDESANQEGNQKASMEDEMDLEEGCPHDEDQEDLEEGELTEWAPGHEPAGETHDFTGAPLKGAPKGTKARHSRWYAGDTTADSGGAGGHRDRGGYAHDDPESEEYHTDAALEKRRDYQRWKIRAGIAEEIEVDERMLTLEEARDVARRIFERIQKEL